MIERADRTQVKEVFRLLPHRSKRSDEPDFSTVLKFTGQQ